MADTWAASWAAEAQRFNMTHVPAGSATGGQFGTSSGGSAKPAAKAPAKTPAKAAPAHVMSAAHAAEKARLLAQAHKDAAEAAALEKQLAGLEKQAATAQAAAKKSAAAAKASLKAGHVVHHRKHAAHHAAHHKHHQSLKQKITALKDRIHALRTQAAGLEKQANAIRSGGAVMSDTWAQRGSDLKYGHGSALWKYWTRGEGFAKWSGAVHKWTTLRDLLLKAGVPAISADGLTTNIITAVMPGYMKQAHAKTEHKAGRADMAKQDVMDKPTASRALVEIRRDCQLEDIHIVRMGEGDSSGRVVEAYATVFDQPVNIRDEQGHYTEVIDRSAFNDILAHIRRARGGLPASVKVLYNHGKTIEGIPAPEFQKPLGKPLFVEPESRGLLTRTEYGKTPLGEEVLELIRGGSITAQSFVGGCITSDPELRGPGDRYRARNGVLTSVRRMVMGLREYGPVLWPAYSGAEILGVRSQLPGSPDDGAPDDPDDEEYGPDDEAAVAGSVPEDTTSQRYHQHALYALRSKEQREKAGLVW